MALEIDDRERAAVGAGHELQNAERERGASRGVGEQSHLRRSRGDFDVDGGVGLQGVVEVGAEYP